MKSVDPQACRRALREISEIAAVAVLHDSQMTEQEALQAISAIAGWVVEEAPGDREACAEVVRRLDVMTRTIDIDDLADSDAAVHFDDALEILERRPGPARAGVSDRDLEML